MFLAIYYYEIIKTGRLCHIIPAYARMTIKKKNPLSGKRKKGLIFRG